MWSGMEFTLSLDYNCFIIIFQFVDEHKNKSQQEYEIKRKRKEIDPLQVAY